MSLVPVLEATTEAEVVVVMHVVVVEVHHRADHLSSPSSLSNNPQAINTTKIGRNLLNHRPNVEDVATAIHTLGNAQQRGRPVLSVRIQDTLHKCAGQLSPGLIKET